MSGSYLQDFYFFTIISTISCKKNMLSNNFEDIICASFEFLLLNCSITNKIFYCFIIVTDSVYDESKHNIGNRTF